MQAGKIQMSNVNTARGTPPLLYPINVSVCVEEAPGNNWQKALYSINSFSETYGLLRTNVFIIIPICAWGPPKAVTLCIKTARRNEA